MSTLDSDSRESSESLLSIEDSGIRDVLALACGCLGNDDGPAKEVDELVLD